MTILASIPSPPVSAWPIGPFTLRAYAICIILGVVAAVIIGNRRWVARGGQPGVVLDLVLWAVPFGMVGARLYHVITDYQLYFGPGKNPVRALEIWNGGLGVWGAIVGGGVGVWIACRRRGIPLPAMADAVAPGIVVAQAIGRLGNWFNQELFGGPTSLPWGLEIDPGKRPDGLEQFATYHPTFLYEALWCLGVAALVIWADRRWTLGHGRAFALYVAAYTVGRAWIEYMRIDDVNHVLGMRLNFWVSLVVLAGAIAYMVRSAQLRPGREAPETLSPGVSTSAESSEDEAADDAADSADTADAADTSDSDDTEATTEAPDEPEATDEAGEADEADDADNAEGDDGSDKADQTDQTDQTDKDSNPVK